MTVIAIDPTTGQSFYSQQPTTFVFSGFPATAAGGSTTASASGAAPGTGVAPSNAMRTVCGACGGVMPPPGVALGVDGVGGVVNNPLIVTGGTQHENVVIASTDHGNAGMKKVL